jgi:hypothetical protein
LGQQDMLGLCVYFILPTSMYHGAVFDKVSYKSILKQFFYDFFPNGTISLNLGLML